MRTDYSFLTSSQPTARDDGIIMQLFIFCCLLFSCLAVQANPYYGTALCAYPQYECVKVGAGGSWERLFPMKNNAISCNDSTAPIMPFGAGREIVVPRQLQDVTLLDISPFPLQINDLDKQVIVDQDKWPGVPIKTENSLNGGPLPQVAINAQIVLILVKP